MCRGVKENTTLKHLVLNKMTFDPQLACQYIAKTSARYNTTLRGVHLAGNFMPIDAGMCFFFAYYLYVCLHGRYPNVIFFFVCLFSLLCFLFLLAWFVLFVRFLLISFFFFFLILLCSNFAFVLASFL